ncbi:MAG: DUF5819 family protein [Micrococcaceae bacterium]
MKKKAASIAVLSVGALIGAAHLGATLAFTGPDTPIKSSLQPALNRYFLGPLDQGWNLFAPGPYSQDEYFTVRACLSEADVCAGGSSSGAEFTEWRNVTAEEMAGMTGNIFSTRETKQSKAVLSRVWGAAGRLSEEQRQQVEEPAILGAPTFGVDLDSAEAAEQYSSGQLQTMRSYLRLEEAAVGYASLYAQTEWNNPSMVEIQLIRESVTPFEQRFDPPEEPSRSTTYIGWRDVLTFDDETVSAWS